MSDQQRLNVMIDVSASIASAAPALLYLAEQYPLNIVLRGAPEVEQHMTEIVKLLSASRYNQPTFVSAVLPSTADFFHSVRGASLANVHAATQEGCAFKLRA